MSVIVLWREAPGRMRGVPCLGVYYAVLRKRNPVMG